MAKITWLEVLNQQAEWKTPQDCFSWLSSVMGKVPRITDLELKEFLDTLDFMRSLVSEHHFHGRFDSDKLDVRLARIRPAFGTQLSNSELSARLPALRAGSAGKTDGELVACLGDTLLLDFATFMSRVLQSEPGASLARCEGLYRDADSIAWQAPYAQELEQEWRKELPVLVETGNVLAPDIQRCADFFLARPKSRFCSEACRFTTFQISKQLTQPNYLADKQRRYRQKHKSE